MNSVFGKGYLKTDVDPTLDLFLEIEKLKKEKNAILLSHYYQDSDIQDVADYVGDSLGLSQQAAKTKANIIVFAGVHFMAETAKILSPEKKVLLPDINAGCSLAESCPADKFAEFKKSYPNHLVISYINCSAEIKTMTDIVCTSSNAEKIVKSLPKEQKIIFAPDKNLGKYIMKKTGREMMLWNGSCMVHEIFSLEKIIALKAKYPKAKLLAHPECETAVLDAADFIGSTTGILNYSKKSNDKEFIVATETGILHQMQKASPEKTFIPAPPDNSCACNDCPHMKLNTLEKLYTCLKYEQPEIILSDELIKKAGKSIKKMLELSVYFFFMAVSCFSQPKQEINPNGYNKFYYDSGKISSEGNMRDGKPDGYWRTYTKTGILKSEGNRKNFLLDSTWKFYSDEGKIITEINYFQGKKNGLKKNYDEEKKLILDENYMNDIRQGITNQYYSSGKIKMKLPFDKGKEDGVGYEYDEQGNIITLIEYKLGFIKAQEKINRIDKNGWKQGMWKEFYPETSVGKQVIKSECSYSDDKKNGYCKEYSPEGKLLAVKKFILGKEEKDALELAKAEVKKEYYESGKIKSTSTYVNGMLEGTKKEFTEEGKISSAKIYKEGILSGEGIEDESGKQQGLWKEYYQGGVLKAKGEYNEGKKAGEWEFYYPNGKMEQKGRYDKRGRAQGTWKWYYENGALLREENYENDIREGTMTEYDSTGKIITKGEFTDGKQEGRWTYELGDFKEEGAYKSDVKDGNWKSWWTDNNQLRFEGIYIDGSENGKHTYYYHDGKISVEGKYVMGQKDGNWSYYNPYDEKGEYDWKNPEASRIVTVTYKMGKEIKFDGERVKPTDDDKESSASEKLKEKNK